MADEKPDPAQPTPAPEKPERPAEPDNQQTFTLIDPFDRPVDRPIPVEREDFLKF